MPLRLDSKVAGFAADFTALVDARREADEDVSRDVGAILVGVDQRVFLYARIRTGQQGGDDRQGYALRVNKAEHN